MHNENLAQILAPTVKRSLAAEVAERLRNAILGGQLAPEEPLREAALSELMGVSRGPIREALSLLEREGLVMVTPTGRTRVSAPLTQGFRRGFQPAPRPRAAGDRIRLHAGDTGRY